MAIAEGTQSIPSELLDAYRGNLTEKMPTGFIRARYPHRLPRFQNNRGSPTPPQRLQRSRFNSAISKFKELPAAEKTRWYDSMPVWGSFLWYYDYFVLSALMSITGLPGNAAAGIKREDLYLITMPATAPQDFTLTITPVNPTKAYVRFFGANVAIRPDDEYLWVEPFVKAMYSSSVIIRNPITTNLQSVQVEAQVTEYL